jgi:hypothetical protein
MGKLKRKLKKTSIGRGIEIVPWVERLNYFNDFFRVEGYSLNTEIIDMNDSIIVMRGVVYDPDRNPVADGVAHKKTSEPFSFQKCQSGALNRALFILGIVDSGEETIMDEDEAKELQQVKAQDSMTVYESMVNHIPVDYTVVEQRIPANKGTLTSEQLKNLKSLINAEKSKKAVKQASK